MITNNSVNMIDSVDSHCVFDRVQRFQMMKSQIKILNALFNRSTAHTHTPKKNESKTTSQCIVRKNNCINAAACATGSWDWFTICLLLDWRNPLYFQLIPTNINQPIHVHSNDILSMFQPGIFDYLLSLKLLLFFCPIYVDFLSKNPTHEWHQRRARKKKKNLLHRTCTFQ